MITDAGIKVISYGEASKSCLKGVTDHMPLPWPGLR